MKFGDLIESQADIQQDWSDLVAYFNADERSQLVKKSCEELWVHLSKLKNFSDEFVFKNIASLANVDFTPLKYRN